MHCGPSTLQLVSVLLHLTSAFEKMLADTCPIKFLAGIPSHVNLTAAADELHKQQAASIPVAAGFLVAALFVLLMGHKLVKPTLFLAGGAVGFFGGIVGTNILIDKTNFSVSPLRLACFMLFYRAIRFIQFLPPSPHLRRTSPTAPSSARSRPSSPSSAASSPSASSASASLSSAPPPVRASATSSTRPPSTTSRARSCSGRACRSCSRSRSASARSPA